MLNFLPNPFFNVTSSSAPASPAPSLSSLSLEEESKKDLIARTVYVSGIDHEVCFFLSPSLFLFAEQRLSRFHQSNLFSSSFWMHSYLPQLEEEDIKHFFGICGRVTACRIKGDTSHPTKFAFVEFGDLMGAKNAFQCTGYVLGKNILRVNHSKLAIESTRYFLPIFLRFDLSLAHDLGGFMSWITSIYYLSLSLLHIFFVIFSFPW